MRRKRQRLQPNTFPFIAVLLCAMGSLILLLLVLDRRAKMVAQAKAAQSLKTADELSAKELARATTEREADAKRQDEWQRLREELHVYLLTQQEQVLGDLSKVQSQQAAVKQQIESGKVQQAKLLQHLHVEQKRLEGLRDELHQRQTALTQAQQQSGKAKQELAKLDAELTQLELALANLHKLRAQQKQVYSVIPYKGKRGDDRKPHYLECVANGVIFHPDRLAVTGVEFSPLNVRNELDRRIQARNASDSPADKKRKPYLFVLVRPEGLKSYYALGSALAGLQVDLGYELIDTDWQLDFSDDGKVGPSSEDVVVAAPPAAPGLPGSGKAVKGFQGKGQPDAGGTSGPAGMSGVAGSVTEPAWRPKAGIGTPITGAYSPVLPGTTLGKGIAGSSKDVAAQANGKSGAGSPSGTPVGNGPPGSPPALTSTPGAKEPHGKEPIDKSHQNSEPPEGSQHDGPAGKDSPKQPAAPGEQGMPAFSGPLTAGPLQSDKLKPPTPLGMLLGNRDWNITFTCSAQGVTLLLSGQQYTIAMLETSYQGEHPLRQAVRDLIARKQATVRPGQAPYRPILRFEVPPDGQRAYLLGYAVLDSLSLPVVRHNIKPNEPKLEDYYRQP